jgi:hypothetical protein
VLDKIPIKYYARGTDRTEILSKLYEYLLNRTENVEALCSDFMEKVCLVGSMQKTFSSLGYNSNRLVFECLLWMLLVLENENFDLAQVTDIDFFRRLGKIISDNLEK